MAYALRYDVVTPALLREMAILRTGQILHSEYELDQHIPLARACGITDAQIAALPDWRASYLFDEKQRALLAYTEAVALMAARSTTPPTPPLPNSSARRKSSN